jgi:hypothetical protein
MKTKTIFQQIVLIHDIYQAQFLDIRMGARQGRLWTLQSFQKALEQAGLKTELIGQNDGDPTDPQVGDYLLLVEGRFLIDIAYTKRLDSVSAESARRVPRQLVGKIDIQFNFGSHEPEYRSPYYEGAEEGDFPDFLLRENA